MCGGSGAAQRDAVSHGVRSEHGAHPRPPLAPEPRGVGARSHPQAAPGPQGGALTLLRHHSGSSAPPSAGSWRKPGPCTSGIMDSLELLEEILPLGEM